MTDIITRAERLIENAAPGPWYPHNDQWPGDMVVNDAGREMGWHGEQLRVTIHTVNPAPDAELIAAAPELAAALAKETYEYAVQVKRRDVWEYTYESWDSRWQESYAVQEVRAQRDHPGEETRIVRRRVSPPEVINE